jgi:aspartyl-tRNA(Asn)/glutamyl-tRNA(Gln) amidotransferase subunit C
MVEIRGEVRGFLFWRPSRFCHFCIQRIAMVSISQTEVEHVAQLARLELTETEKSRFADQLSHILTYVDQLQGVPTEGIPPTASVANEEIMFREDTPRACLPLKKTLANAPESHDGFFVVPKILGK